MTIPISILVQAAVLNIDNVIHSTVNLKNTTATNSQNVQVACQLALVLLVVVEANNRLSFECFFLQNGHERRG